MKKKEIKKIVTLSYTNNTLDKSRVSKFTSGLSRKDLKEYIKMLKVIEQKKTLIVFMPNIIKGNLLEKDLKNKFPGKKIKFRQDKDLIAGVKILDFDKMYDFSIKNKLDNMISNIN